MSAADFTRRWIGLFALLAALITLTPYVLHLIVQNSGCDAARGGCTATQSAFAAYGPWAVLAVVLIPLAVLIAARALTVGVFAWAFPFGLLMIAGSLPLLFALNHFRDADFVDGLMAMPALTPLLFLLVLLVSLSAHDDEDSHGAAAAAWRTVLAFVAAVAVFVTAPAWLIGFASLPWVGRFALPIAASLSRAHEALGITGHLEQIGLGCLIALIVAAAGLVLASRKRASPIRRLSRA